MPELPVYLIKVNVALILFFLAYRFALRPLTFYTLNRFFLVGGIVFSSLYPIVNISELISKNDTINEKLIVIVPDWNSVQQTVVTADPSFNYWSLLIGLFWTGVVIMAMRLIIRLVSLHRVHASSTSETYHIFKYRRVNDEVNPFSFFQNIYLNPGQLKEKDLLSVLKHEQVHVEEWHTLDVLLAEVNVVFYWFNPGVWMIKNAIKENLEFITDRRVLQSGVDHKSYQYSLLEISTLSQKHSLANNFNLPDIKKRIMMMNKKRSSGKQISRYVLLLPVVILLSLVFTVSKAQLEKTDLKPSDKKDMVEKAVGILAEDLPKLIVKNSEKIYSQVRDEKVETDTSFVRIKNNGKPALYVIDGVRTTDSTVISSISPENIKSVSVMKDKSAINFYGKEGENGVIIVTTKNAKPYIPPQIVLDRKYPKGPKPLYVIDGVPIDSADIGMLAPDNIESISVVKRGSPTELYGKKGENGVILVTTKGSVPIFPMELSPNNDGVNDVLSIKGLGKLGSVNLKVYNKWGALVFEQSDYKNNWNGKGLNGDLPQGNYSSTITVESDKRVFTGSFNLLR